MSRTPLFGPATCGFHYILIAVNVLRRDGSGDNVLADVLRGWSIPELGLWPQVGLRDDICYKSSQLPSG